MADQGIYKYTTAIQLKILAVLWRDEQSYNLYRETIKPKYFSKAIHIDLCRIIFDYKEKYKKSPTLDVLVEEVTTMCSKTATKKKVENDYLDAIDKMSQMDLFDIDYIKDKILSFGKRQALVDAVIESAEILEKKPNTEYNKIEKIVRDAMLVGENTNDLGTDLYENVEERFMSYLSDEDVIERIPTGMNKLDELLKGGGGKGELIVVTASPGLGKTTTLITMGASAIENGYNVLHVSLENNEKQILKNYDVRLLKKNVEYIKENLDKSLQAFTNIKRYRKGILKVKKYPTKSVTTNTIRGLLDQLKVVENFVPDVVIVDYGAILKPLNNYSDKRNCIEENYEELRAIADDYNVVLYTGAQANRGALSKKVVTKADLAECFAISNIADVMVCLCQTLKEKANSEMRLFLTKVRDSADGLMLKGRILYDIKKVEFDEVVDMNAQDNDSDDEEDTEDDW